MLRVQVRIYCGEPTYILWRTYIYIVDNVHIYCGEPTYILWMTYVYIVGNLRDVPEYCKKNPIIYNIIVVSNE